MSKKNLYGLLIVISLVLSYGGIYIFIEGLGAQLSARSFLIDNFPFISSDGMNIGGLAFITGVLLMVYSTVMWAKTPSKKQTLGRKSKTEHKS